MPRSKKELDKDLMFKKIMPALSDNPFSAVRMGQAESPAVPAVQDNLAALHSRLFVPPHTSTEAQAATHNVMEHLVLQYVDEVIQKFHTCSCDRCRCDICALALNLLPPKYVVAEPEKAGEKQNNISKKLVMDALIKAVIQVRSHPRH